MKDLITKALEQRKVKNEEAAAATETAANEEKKED